jgi:hypothetical protein
MPKRKAEVDGAAEPELRRSTRRKSAAPQTATKRAAEEDEPVDVKSKKPVKATKLTVADDVKGGKKKVDPPSL